MSGTLAAQTISFDEISYDIRRPSTQIEVKPNYQNVGLISFPTKALLMGQMMVGGNGQAATVYQIFQVGQGAALFGAGSMLAAMCDKFVLANPFTPLFAIGTWPVANATAATGTLTLTGALIGNAGVPLYIAGRYYPVVLAQTASLSSQAGTIAALINADPLSYVTAASAAGVATLTAKSGGSYGNALRIRIGTGGDYVAPPGTWACTIAPMSGGAGDPDITPLLTAIANDWYTDIQLGWTDTANLGLMNAEADARYTATGRKDTTVYVGYDMTLGAALAANGQSNSRFLTRLPSYGSVSPPWEWGAVYAGIASFQFANDPARQLRSLSLPGLYAPAPRDRYLDNDREQLLRNGFSTFTVLSDGTITIERAVSSYQVSPLGVPDTAWLDLMTAKTMTRIRYDWASYLGLVYPRAKLADDGAPAALYSDVVATPRRVWNSWAARCTLYEQQAWIEGAKDTSARASFVRNRSDRNRIDARQIVNVIGNFMVFAGRLEFEA